MGVHSSARTELYSTAPVLDGSKFQLHTHILRTEMGVSKQVEHPVCAAVTAWSRRVSHEQEQMGQHQPRLPICCAAIAFHGIINHVWMPSEDVMRTVKMSSVDLYAILQVGITDCALKSGPFFRDASSVCCSNLVIF